MYKGSVLSLLGMHTDSAYHHGDDGMGGVPDPDPPSHDLVQPKHAVTAMIDIVDKHPGRSFCGGKIILYGGGANCTIKASSVPQGSLFNIA